jgi:dihydrolipoamide dehydrogenase
MAGRGEATSEGKNGDGKNGDGKNGDDGNGNNGDGRRGASYDLVVIGSGPGGYVAAIRAAQLGFKVACVEKAELGGICGNWGCIPTKALLRSAEMLELLREAGKFGLTAENVGFDFAQVIARSRKVAQEQARGVALLFKKNGIDHLMGTARLAPPRRLLVDGMEVTAMNILLATGARPRAFPGLEPDGDRVVTYREAMVLPKVPESLVVIGAGAIGVEFAYFYSVLGTRVTLVEMLDRVLPVEDEEISQALARSLRRRKGFEILTGHRVEGIARETDGVKVTVLSGVGERREIAAERALVAVGVTGNVEGLGLEDVGVKIERGHIAVDRSTYRTSVEGIYAIGDVIGAPWLAHKASAEGIACVERMAGYAPVHEVNYGAIPGCTYCKPEVASVGLTERQAREAGHEVKVGRFPLKASGKARAVGDTEGFVKVVLDARYGEILGAHFIGGDATDLVAELTLARTAELTAEEVLGTVHAHPTMAEIIKEAVGDALGEAIDI